MLDYACDKPDHDTHLAEISVITQVLLHLKYDFLRNAAGPDWKNFAHSK